MNKTPITVQTIVKAPIDKVWNFWNKPEHITQWAFADDSWEAPSAVNDLRVGGKFVTVMAAKDLPAQAGKSARFDFGGTYTAVKEHELIEYDMGESGRHVRVEFKLVPQGVEVIEEFDPEQENPEEMQQKGWQSILDNFKKHVEEN